MDHNNNNNSDSKTLVVTLTKDAEAGPNGQIAYTAEIEGDSGSRWFGSLWIYSRLDQAAFRDGVLSAVSGCLRLSEGYTLSSSESQRLNADLHNALKLLEQVSSSTITLRYRLTKKEPKLVFEPADGAGDVHILIADGDHFKWPFASVSLPETHDKINRELSLRGFGCLNYVPVRHALIEARRGRRQELTITKKSAEA